MKKIKILRAIILVLLTLQLLSFVMGFVQYNEFEQLHETLIFGKFNFVIHSILSLCTIAGLFFLVFALNAVIKKDFFVTIATKRFKIAGLFLFMVGLGQIVFNSAVLIKETNLKNEYFFTGIEKAFILIVIAFGLFVVAELIQNGSVLKQENELTI